MGVIAHLDERSGSPASAAFPSAVSGILSRAVNGLSAAANSVLTPSRRSGPGSGSDPSSGGSGSSILARYVQIISRADDERTEEECHPQPNMNLCEKPSASSRIDIIVPTVIAALILLGLFITLFLFHMRRKRRDEEEWSKNNHHEMEDYGFEVPERPGNTYKPPAR